MKEGIAERNSLASPINKYTLQFSYLKRRPSLEKRKNVVSVMDGHSNRNAQDYHSSIGNYLHQSIPLTGDRLAVKSLSLSLEKRAKTKNTGSFSLSQQQDKSIIVRSFPKRKQKSKELHIFKMLRRYTQETRLIEQAKQKIQKFSKQKEVCTGLRPRLKTKQMQTVPKQRYCLNRQRGGQYIQSGQKVDLGKSLISIKVNPLKRNP